MEPSENSNPKRTKAFVALGHLDYAHHLLSEAGAQDAAEATRQATNLADRGVDATAAKDAP